MPTITLGSTTIYNNATKAGGIYHKFTPGNFSPNPIETTPDIGEGTFIKCGRMGSATHTLEVAYIVTAAQWRTLYNGLQVALRNVTPRTLSVPEINSTNTEYSKCRIQSIAPWEKTVTLDENVGFAAGQERWLVQTTITFIQYF